jgi:hypothetical protein
MSKRWNKEEKAKLIKLYSNGDNFAEIAKELDRSESAIKLRLESIVYDGIAKGMSISDLEKILNTESQIITQMFYSHRSFKESRGEDVISLKDVGKKLDPKNKSNKKNKSETKSETKSDKMDKLISDTNKLNKQNKSIKTETKPDSKIKKIIDQNTVMEAIINNNEFKKKIKKLYKNGKLSADEKRALEKIL